ncbi:MAG: redox-regulated ATPase YchF [Deltaproteobacteria bacterium CG_4_9_14_3_um_filter_63_12]|nr:MAG: redox-regulated ATPase YchF [Deltaproteobacteria bacterium CG_4_9_14_3_um_filter_63_12]
MKRKSIRGKRSKKSKVLAPQLPRPYHAARSTYTDHLGWSRGNELDPFSKRRLMRVGIIGFAGSGKTTIFNALAGIGGDVAPGKAGRINLREVQVPDARIDKLSLMYQPKKTIYASIQLADLPGQAPGSGGGFDANSIAKMREMDLLVIVARAFDNPYINAPIDPASEIGGMLAELLLADYTVVEKKVMRLRKEAAKGTERDLFEQLFATLEAEQWLSTLELSEQSLELLTGFRLLTLKPVLVVLNTPEDKADHDSASELIEPLSSFEAPIFALSAKLEAEIAELDPEEQLAFLAEIGIQGTARDRFIRAAYKSLDLISFFTVGEDEVRAWTVQRGANAQTSAGKIHTDLSKRFIRAEHMTCADLIELGSEAKVKEAGKFSLKGKEYITQDGDILHIRAS